MKRLLFIAGPLPALILMFSIQNSVAGSATWKTSPNSGDWNTATNWMPPTVPNAPSDTATFATSNRTAVSISANTEVDGIVFNANANAFRVTARARFVLTISGVGITNNSGTVQNFVTAVSTTGRQSEIQFTNGATAGNLTVFTNNDNPVSGLGGSVTQFFGTSSAGNATFVNKSGTNGSGSGGGGMTFNDASTAGFGTFINTSPLPGNGPPFIFFNNSSTAGTGTFTNGGLLAFGDTSTAGNGTFMNNGASTAGAFNGQISIGNTATAGNGTFVSKGGEENGAQGGFIECGSGGNGTFIIERGSVSGACGPSVKFLTGFLTRATASAG